MSITPPIPSGRHGYKVLEPGALPDGRVTTVSVGLGDAVKQICLTRHNGRYGALDNACPHQGGPLGEGSIENGCLRCPWHGWDFDPLTGKPPGGGLGIRVTGPAELDPALKAALRYEGPATVEIIADAEQI